MCEVAVAPSVFVSRVLAIEQRVFVLNRKSRLYQALLLKISQNAAKRLAKTRDWRRAKRGALCFVDEAVSLRFALNAGYSKVLKGLVGTRALPPRSVYSTFITHNFLMNSHSWRSLLDQPDVE